MDAPRKKRRRSPISPIVIRGRVATVILPDGYEAIIDAADVPLVEGRPWRAFCGDGVHTYVIEAKDKGERMHRLLMQAPPGQMVDHVDNNGLNNRRSNLRLCSHVENMANRSGSTKSAVGLKGVSRWRGRFRSEISHDGRRFFLGYFEKANEAAAAYAGAARVLAGKFAKRPSQAKTGE